jgi:hypothetical protein
MGCSLAGVPTPWPLTRLYATALCAPGNPGMPRDHNVRYASHGESRSGHTSGSRCWVISFMDAVPDP